MRNFVLKNKIKSLEGNPITDPKKFDLLMGTHLGTLEGEKEKVVIGKSLISGNVIDLGKYRAEKTWETEKPLMPDLTTNQSTREIFVAHT